MKLTFMASPEDVRFYWPRIAPLIERCVSEAVVGREFTADDLCELALIGTALPFFAEDEDGVTIAGVLEITRYPRRTALNFMALAGHGLMASAEALFDEIKAFGRAIGAHYIEAAAAPAMARLLSRKLGFEPQYQLLRINL